MPYREGMENGGYKIREAKAPKGYQLNHDAFEIKFAKTYDFSRNNPINIVVTDKKNTGTNTGVSGAVVPACAAAATAAVAIIIIVAVKRKKSKKDEEAEDSNDSDKKAE